MAAIPPRCASARRSVSTTSRARPTACRSPASPPPKPRSPASRSRRRHEPDAALTLAALASGGKPALAAALAALERAPEDESTLALLDAAYAAPRAPGRRRHRPARRRQVDAPGRAHRALARGRAERRRHRRRSVVAALGRRLARRSHAAPHRSRAMPASSSARWRRATSSAASPRSPIPPWC